MQVKSYFFLLLLSFLSLATSVRFTVTRKDEGDSFFWSGTDATRCYELSRNTAYMSGSGCQCEHKLTYSTENKICQSYEEQGNIIK